MILKLIKGLFFATFVSLLIGFIVSFFPRGESLFASSSIQENHLVKAVFNPNKPIHLSSDTLVTYLKQIPLHFAYKQVELDGSALFVKLNVTRSSSQSTAGSQTAEGVQEQIFQDVYQLLDTLYRYTTNVDQVYIRFIREDQSLASGAQLHTANEPIRRALMLSVESERGSFELEPLEAVLDQQELEASITAQTNIIYGTGWDFEKNR